jgi:replicative DNA helicase
MEVKERVMPQSPEIEQVLLGAIMLDPDKLTSVLEIIKPDCFYLDQHRFIFQSMVDLKMRGLQPDLPSVIDDLKRQDLIEKCGGAGFLASLLNSVPTSAHAEFHAEIVAEKHVMRRLIRICTEIVDAGYRQELSADEMLEWAEKAVMNVTRFGRSAEYSVVGEVLAKLFENIVSTHQYRSAHPDEKYYPGERSGFDELDELLGGFHQGSLNIIAARPGIGKTSLAMNAALFAARNNKDRYPVLIFSLEMPNEMIATRFLSTESKIPIGVIEAADMDDAGWHSFTKAVRRLSGVNILLNDSSSVTVRQIASTARRVVSKFDGIALIIVDYLQLMRGDGRYENRVTEVSAISRGLKTLALELRVPILACSQLSRQAVTREEQKPMLSDLRESGSIEQDADTVIFLSPYIAPEGSSLPVNSPEYIERVRRAQGNTSAKVWCSVGKNRNGPVGDCPMMFLQEYCKFVPGDWREFPTNFKGPEYRSGTKHTKRRGPKE